MIHATKYDNNAIIGNTKTGATTDFPSVIPRPKSFGFPYISNIIAGFNFKIK